MSSVCCTNIQESTAVIRAAAALTFDDAEQECLVPHILGLSLLANLPHPPASTPHAALLPRLPRRHLMCTASAAAAGSAEGAEAPPRRPRRVCIMVEPSPFTYVCGYMNRYRNTIRFLTEAGVEVLVVTPGPGVTVPGVDFSAACDQPQDFHGARVVQAMSFGLPWYLSLPLSFGLSPRIYKEVK